ncbi:MAG: 1-(5-phosphoribosyl)-5-[(5-phosphoribosylamino)methylideneamino]imidazole-4-carboxamide isomerase [Immundisolibacterales bacterium]|nr:1-(5-phosphoribosyl)-5-[(5-phosphoribosylamino)methylideneamino]imidazole-4-carboxamide isomerase [Immundisolibacterales bacterium]
MLLIPAIDIKDGKCVRLRQGRMEDATVFADDPRDAARRWVEAGARRLHLVDLDGAIEGAPRNAEIIGGLVAEFPDIDIQVGGGIRDDETIEGYLATGVRYVILGTRAVTTPGFVADACVEFPGHIMVGLDARDGRVAVDGWSKLTRFRVDELARRIEDCGVEAIVHTDIGRDGMLEGANVEATEALARDLHVPVFASGGIRGLDDIRALCAAADAGIAGAIIGRALYEGTLDYAAATALASELGGESWGL